LSAQRRSELDSVTAIASWLLLRPAPFAVHFYEFREIWMLFDQQLVDGCHMRFSSLANGQTRLLGTTVSQRVGPMEVIEQQPAARS
jgi:hypothetical protein